MKEAWTLDGLPRSTMAEVDWSNCASSSGLEMRHASRIAMPKSYLLRWLSHCSPTKSCSAAIASSSASMICVYRHMAGVAPRQPKRAKENRRWRVKIVMDKPKSTDAGNHHVYWKERSSEIGYGVH